MKAMSTGRARKFSQSVSCPTNTLMPPKANRIRAEATNNKMRMRIIMPSTFSKYRFGRLSSGKGHPAVLKTDVIRKHSVINCIHGVSITRNRHLSQESGEEPASETSTTDSTSALDAVALGWYTSPLARLGPPNNNEQMTPQRSTFSGTKLK